MHCPSFYYSQERNSVRNAVYKDELEYPIYGVIKCLIIKKAIKEYEMGK